MGGTLAPTAAPGGIAGTGITAFVQVSSKKDAPPPPPETAGAYQKKSGENSGVIAMINLLVQDLDKEMTEGTTTENDAQSDYESLMKNAAEKRTENSKSLADKNSAKADMKSTLDTSNADKDSTSKELAATLQYIHQLHGECDWLLKYFEVRKEARASEVDALGKAKAVLSGADFSLLQTRSAKFLQKSRFTVKDKVYVDGGLFAEGSQLDNNVMCHEHKGTSTFKVCGCGVKVVAHLLTECQTYKQYDEQIGQCNCKSDACEEKTLTSGYSSPFEWKAASFEISPC
jgi:hypothetical protein